MDEEKYIRGFNHAYFLKVHKPELLKSILSTSSENYYIEGLKDGERTFRNQQIKSRTQELKNLKSKDVDLGLER